MKLTLNFSILLVFMALAALGQSQDSYTYSSEFTWGVNKNSSGGLVGGFVFKKARKLKSDRILETFGLEIMNVKHGQEVRRNSTVGNFFIYGKSNYLYAFRFQYGRDFILFEKASQQGVEIKAVFAGGPTLGLLAPYYIERSDDSPWLTIREQYNPDNPNHSYQNIIGTGHLLEGLSESKLRLGSNIKAAANFEMGTIKSQVTGFEVGFLLDAYLKKVVLMPTAKNHSVFPTVFITIFYGTRK